MKLFTTRPIFGRLPPLMAYLYALGFAASTATHTAAAEPIPRADAEYANHVRPILAKYCLTCHSKEKMKGDLNLDRFNSLDAVHKDPRA